MLTPSIMADPGMLTQPARTNAKLAGDQDEFASVLARTTTAGKTPEEITREGAESLIATALVGPIFKRMRESSMAAAPFAPNSAERTFRAMQDATFAQRLVKSTRWPLVDAVAQRLLMKAGGAQAASTTGVAP